jgi:hypothetical protein
MLGHCWHVTVFLEITEVAIKFWPAVFHDKHIFKIHKILILAKMGWGTFLATFSQTHLVALICTRMKYCPVSKYVFIVAIFSFHGI